MSNRIKLALVGALTVVLIAIGGAYFYLHSEKSTPELALSKVNEAIVAHDLSAFNRLVDTEQLLSSSYDAFVEGLTESDQSMTPEAREAILNFTQMLRQPIINSLKSAIESYVETGSIENVAAADENSLAAAEIMDRAGLRKLEFRSIDGVSSDLENLNLAIADVRFYQSETAEEFVFKVLLERDEDVDWHITRIENFREFTESTAKIRRAALDKYLEQTSEINLRHDQTIREAEQKYGAILSLGNLGQDQTRFDLKILLTDVVKKDWEVRKQELFSVEVPHAAEPLQNLRMRICDLSIESADEYARWMEDKKGATVKSAEEKNRQAQILTDEERNLINRMTRRAAVE